ncbi:MAG: methyltransferase [Pseudobdellovibrionaceae bacterium]
MSLNPSAKEMLPQDAKMLAQFIAMAPFVFQTALCLRDFGILKILAEKPEGLHFDEIMTKANLSRYSLSVLLDAGESSRIVENEEEVYKLTQTGVFLEKDAITRVNMNFTQDVCYEGLFSLKEALQENKPAGLKVFGKWPTIYEGLAHLPQKVQKSWFEFDHFFSDDSFPRALPIIFEENPETVLDVGGNTGKFAMACAAFAPAAKITIVDHPGQLEMANKNIAAKDLSDRLTFVPMNLLDHSKPLPKNCDVIWMSQLLSCFSEEDVVQLLRRAKESMGPNSALFIMETFTDNQKFNVAKFCLDMTSLYFTAMANGNSRMYRSEYFYQLIERAGLKIVKEHPYVRLNHTILKCVPA